MPDSIQQVTIVGNVGKTPESKVVGNQTVYSFTVAVNDPERQPDGTYHKRTYWWTIDCWSNQLPFGLEKGVKVTVIGTMRLVFDKEGHLRVDQNGMPWLKLRTDAWHVLVGGRRAAAEGNSSTPASNGDDSTPAPAPSVAGADPLDELPF